MSKRVKRLSDQEKKGKTDEINPLDQFITEEFEKRLDKLEDRLRSVTEEGKVQRAYKETLRAFRARKALDEKGKHRQITYLTDYEFLTKCFRYLTQTRDEGFCLVTGPELNESLYALTRKVEPKLKRQGPAGAEPDLSSLNKMLEKIDEKYGEHLSGYFHSHPGRGKGSTVPSSIDLSTQEKLERGGYPVVGCIFSRDGYFRFYSHEREFQLRISGNGGESVDRRIFKLKEGKVSEIT